MTFAPGTRLLPREDGARRLGACRLRDLARPLFAVALSLAWGAPPVASEAAAASAPGLESAWGMVAKDPTTGQVGAVFAASGPFAAPAHVPHLEASGVAILFPPPEPRQALDLLRELGKGRPPERAARASLSGVTFTPVGAAAILNAKGEEWYSPAGVDGLIVRAGAGYAIVANRPASSGLVDRMEKVFTGSRGPLSTRLLAALRAGHEAGGGVLPARSALIWVSTSASAADSPPDARGVDLRVDDHPFPVLALQGLARSWRLERAIDMALAQGEQGDWPAAAQALRRVLTADPVQGRVHYLLATTLVRSGDIDGALGALKRAFHLEPGLAGFARADTAFAPLRPNPEFQGLVAPSEAGK